MAEQFQPEGPSVWGGTTVYEIGQLAQTAAAGKPRKIRG
jgi:uncharacterized membrane protein YadS